MDDSDEVSESSIWVCDMCGDIYPDTDDLRTMQVQAKEKGREIFAMVVCKGTCQQKIHDDESVIVLTDLPFEGRQTEQGWM